MLFTDENGQLTKDAYDFLFAVFQRIGGSLDSLNAATLEDHTWEEPGNIGSVTPQPGKFTNLTATGTTTTTLLKVISSFACNGRLPQTGYPLGSVPASDLSSAIDLVNNIRQALINNGIASDQDPE